MYGKVFESMYDGTLASEGPWQALVTFQQLIVLADQDGVVDMTASAISRRTSIPIEIIQTGLAVLAKPDPDSRTPDEDGRRIVCLEDHRDWGWQIVNHTKYQQMRNAAERREYLRVAQANRRAKLKAAAVNTCQQVSAEINTSTPKDTYKDEDKDAKEIAPTVLVGGADAYRVPDCPYQELLDLYHQECSALSRVLVMSSMRQKHLMARWRQVCAEDKLDKTAALDWFKWYFQQASSSKFLTGRAGGKGDRAWKADFEWLINGGNFAKVVEGRYSNERSAA